jgi:hypothetical protein
LRICFKVVKNGVNFVAYYFAQSTHWLYRRRAILVQTLPESRSAQSSRRFGFSRILRQSELIIHVVNCTEGSPVKIRTASHWIRIDCSMIAPPPVLSPSSILPSPSTHWAFISTEKNSASVSKRFIFLHFKNLRSLKCCDTVFRQYFLQLSSECNIMDLTNYFCP